MALGDYLLVVPILLLLESAKITGEATTEFTTSRALTRVPTSEGHLFTSAPDTTGGVEMTTPTKEMTRFLPSSTALLSDATNPWSTLGETALPGVATTPPSSSSPGGSIPAGTQGVSPASSSLAMTSISSTGFGGPSEERSTHPPETAVLLISSTAEEMTSSPRSPTPQDKRTSEGPLTTVSTTSQAETTSEEHPSSPPTTTQTMKISPSSLLLLSSTLETSTLPRTTSGVGDTTSSSEVTTMSSKVEVTSWWPRSSLSSTSSSVTQDRSSPKATSTCLPSSNPGRSSVGFSTTTPRGENPETILKVLSSTTTSSSSSKGLPKTSARTRFILSVRLNTPLNITDPSVTRVVRQWLDQELQAKFPVGSFNLTWIG